MFDIVSSPEVTSSIEHALGMEVLRWTPRVPVLLAEEAVGHRGDARSEPAPEQAPGADDQVSAQLRAVGRAFDRGAPHVVRAAQLQTLIGLLHAEQAHELAAFAASRPATADRPDGEVGAAAAATREARSAALQPVSEWAVDEIAVALHVTGTYASGLLTDCLLLVHQLPDTLAALTKGRLGWAHARVLAELVAPLPADVRAIAERRLLARADGKTPPQLRAAAHRVIARLDSTAAARRAAAALRERTVTVYPGRDGLATLSALLPAPVARACQDVLRQLADHSTTDGDTRSRGQRMSDCLVDLVLRPGASALPPVRAQLTLIAGVGTLTGTGHGAQEPGQVAGDVVPAAMLRETAWALGLLQPPAGHPVPAREQPDRAAAAGGCRCGAPMRPAWGAQTAAAVGPLLGRRVNAGGVLAERPQIALVDDISGALLALTDAASLRRAATCGRRDCRTRCPHPLTGRPGLGPPPDTPGYRPGAELDRFVRLRDRRCRFPGCRARPTRCDLDHTAPWPGGPTAHANLCCLCRHHHRLRHQAPGWQLQSSSGDGLQWTTPAGQSLTTRPPRYGADDDLPTEPDPAPAQPTAADTGSADSAAGDSPAPGTGTDHTGTDHTGTDHTGTDQTGTDHVRSDRAGADRVRSDGAGADRVRSDRAGADRVRSDGAGADRVRSDGAGADRIEVDRAGTGRAGTAGADPAATDPAGTAGAGADRAAITAASSSDQGSGSPRPPADDPPPF